MLQLSNKDNNLIGEVKLNYRLDGSPVMVEDKAPKEVLFKAVALLCDLVELEDDGKDTLLRNYCNGFLEAFGCPLYGCAYSL